MTHGQWLRRLGLALEALSAIGILAVRSGNVGIWQRSGLNPNAVLPGLFLFGLALWLSGTIVIQRHRKRP